MKTDKMTDKTNNALIKSLQSCILATQTKQLIQHESKGL
jgi:hypothetical protein